MTSAPAVGLREEKKQRTRELIADTAFALFLEQGFERVSVAMIARQARVSEATVFNYFGTKEQLVYARLDGFWSRLVDAVRDRAPGESAVAAFERFLLAERPMLGSPADRERLAAITRMITSSPALMARERESYERVVAPLAAAIALAETGGSDHRYAARGFLALQRSLVDDVRDEVLADRATTRHADVIADRTRARCARLAAVIAE